MTSRSSDGVVSGWARAVSSAARRASSSARKASSSRRAFIARDCLSVAADEPPDGTSRKLVIGLNAGPIIVLSVPSNDNAWEQQANLISAAHAAASWARARRAQWTGAAEATLTAVEGVAAIEIAPDNDPAPVPPAVEYLPEPIAPAQSPVFRTPDINTAASAAARTLELAAPLVPWLIRGAIAAAVLTAAVVGGRYLWSILPSFSKASTIASKTSTTASSASTTAKGEPKAAKAASAGGGQGTLQVTTTPPGAQVSVDGKPRGVTPLTLADLSVGHHDVVLKGEGGTLQRTVTIAGNQTATIDEGIFSGFVTIYTPFDVTITEGGRVLTADDRHQIMLPAGTHELRITNRALAYEATRKVDIKPGEATNLQLTPEPSTITVTATSAAEVWFDGTRLGDTPLNGAPVPLGEHEIVVRRTSGGERRFTVTVGAKPFTLNVEF